MNAKERNNARRGAWNWALRALVRENRERYQPFLDAERAEEDRFGSCLGHGTADCPLSGGEHGREYRRLLIKATGRARRRLAKEEDLQERFRELRSLRLGEVEAGTAQSRDASAVAEEARMRMEDRCGEWLPLRDYAPDKRASATAYAWSIRTGRGTVWTPAGDFDAEVRTNDDGGLTVWAVWMGDGDE